MSTVKHAFNQADSVPLCSRCCGALLFRCLLSRQHANTFKSIVKIALAIRGFLYFHTNCEIIYSSSVKNTVGSLMGIALNL